MNFISRIIIECAKSLVEEVDDEELRQVYDYYLKYSKGEMYRINQDNKSDMELIPNLIKLEHIFVINHFKTKEECLDYLADELYRLNYVCKDFRYDIYEREKLGSTYLSSGVSFPHGIETHVKKSAIPILLLPKGVFWDEHIVYLVIMLAIKEKDMKVIIEDLPILYKKVLDYQFINNLVMLKNPKDIQNMLLK